MTSSRSSHLHQRLLAELDGFRAGGGSASTPSSKKVKLANLIMSGESSATSSRRRRSMVWAGIRRSAGSFGCEGQRKTKRARPQNRHTRTAQQRKPRALTVLRPSRTNWIAVPPSEKGVGVLAGSGRPAKWLELEMSSSETHRAKHTWRRPTAQNEPWRPRRSHRLDIKES